MRTLRFRARVAQVTQLVSDRERIQTQIFLQPEALALNEQFSVPEL